MQSEVGSSPCLFQHRQHSKARGAAATEAGGAGEGGSAPPKCEQNRVCPSQQGLDTPVSPSRHRQQTQGTGGDSLGVPHAAEPTQGQGCHRQRCHTCAFPQCSHHSPGGTGSPSSGSPLEPRGSQCDPPSIQLTPKRHRESFSPTGPKSRGAGTAPLPLPGTRWAQAGQTPAPPRAQVGGRLLEPHGRRVGAQSISRGYPCARGSCTLLLTPWHVRAPQI